MTITEKITGFKKLGFDYYVFFFLVLMMGKGTDFVSNFDPRFFPFSFIALIAITGYLTKKTRYSSSNISKIALLFPVVCWILYHFFVDYAFEYYSYSYLLIKIYIGCLVVLCYEVRLVEYFAKIVALLAGISIPFWIIANLIGLDNLASFAPFNHSFGQGSSFLVYVTLEKYDLASSADYYTFVRSSGFAWEPGRFASILVLAMVCLIISNKGKIHWKSKEWLSLVSALLTTLSTTGYIAFFALLVLHYLYGSKLSNFKNIAFLLTLSFMISYIMTLPFMAEKMKYHADQDSWTTENASTWLSNRDQIYTVDRFEGLYLDYLNLQFKPLLGCGLSHYDTYVCQNISEMITTSNGIISPLAKLGLLIGLPYYILFFVGSKKLSDYYNYKNRYLLFTICAIFQFSYNFMFEIFMFAIAIFSLLQRVKSKITYV